ncbi:MAG: helix-turn-helix transcriptional regulator [Clostridia bacterium]|nr:helix-turn-helix transcriptional regulator [Clostridia bacterium]
MDSIVQIAINKLSAAFHSLDLTFHQIPGNDEGDVTSYFPGAPEEDILVCVFQGKQIHEPFHRQDFFFINYAYRESYNALSARFDNQITIRENECYISQPYGGYALRGQSDTDISIIGLLIRREAFFREYLHVLSADADLFRFFLEPQKDRFSDEFIHLSFDARHPVRKLLEMMVVEYANRTDDTQAILKSMLLTLLLHIARRYRMENAVLTKKTLPEEIVRYMTSHMEKVSLADIGRTFSYHPSYISSLLHKETGKTFSQILLEKRMERATILLRKTSLPIEEISTMIGYSDHSNFYKSFKNYYGITPREFLAAQT